MARTTLSDIAAVWGVRVFLASLNSGCYDDDLDFLIFRRFFNMLLSFHPVVLRLGTMDRRA